MIRFLRWVFTGDAHAHKWTTIAKNNIYSSQKKNNNEMPTATEYILECEICGNIKGVRI